MKNRRVRTLLPGGGKVESLQGSSLKTGGPFFTKIRKIEAPGARGAPDVAAGMVSRALAESE